MKKLRIYIVALLTLMTTMAMAEVVVLHSGKSVTGTILMQNEQVVIVQDAEGRRFQFPRDEVAEFTVPVEVVQVVEEPKKNTSTQSNCALRLDLNGGALFVSSVGNGGAAAVDLQIGSRRIGERSIFLGGSVGYQAAISNKVYNFLPLMAVVSIPIIEGKHAPELGAALGYGFALKQPQKGGMVAKLDISWRYQYERNYALLLGVQARFQQAQVSFVENISDPAQNYNKDFTSVLGRNFVSIGLRMALQF